MTSRQAWSPLPRPHNTSQKAITGMQNQPTTIERAFELARSGRFSTVTSIRKQLRLEGYQEKSQLQGWALYNQLRLLIAGAVTPPSVIESPSV
jgi:hypothetical protein